MDIIEQFKNGDIEKLIIPFNKEQGMELLRILDDYLQELEEREFPDIRQTHWAQILMELLVVKFLPENNDYDNISQIFQRPSPQDLKIATETSLSKYREALKNLSDK